MSLPFNNKLHTLLRVCTLVVLGSACEAPEEEPPTTLPANMEIGTSETGSEGYRELENGSDAFLARGGQGGFHVWTTPRVLGAKGTVYLDREARLVEDDTLVLRGIRLVVDLPEETMGTWWYPEQSFPSFMCPTPLGVSVIDKEIEFTFRMLDEDENLLAEDTLRVVTRCSEEDQDFCDEVCTGR